MKAYVTSIGERTLELCCESLERNGFEVVVVHDEKTSLAEKLKHIYNDATEDFIRVDADVVPNRNIHEKMLFAPTPVWWVQYLTFDWYKQDLTHGGIHFIKKEALPALRERIEKFLEAERPESQMFRLDEFSNPRRCITLNIVAGLHGFAQSADDIERIIVQKERRKQTGYDWEMVDRLKDLC